MTINKKLLDDLTEQAKVNSRLRQSYDLRTTPNDKSQRMLNALEPGTVVPIHRHNIFSETVCCIRGALKEVIYSIDENGNPIEEESIILRAGSSLAVAQIPIGVWHTAFCLESGTIIMEAKDGVYDSSTSEMLQSGE